MSDDMISVLAKQSDELVKQDEVIARLRALNAELVAALKQWEYAVRIDIKMEGPVYMGVERRNGKKAWEMTRAAIAKAEKEGA